MNFIRLIVIFVLIYLGLALVKSIYRRSITFSKRGHAAVAKMVQCEHCGIYIPSQEAVYAGGHCYCSHEHSQAGPRQRKL
jgi:uncharacterized protein